MLITGTTAAQISPTRIGIASPDNHPPVIHCTVMIIGVRTDQVSAT